MAGAGRSTVGKCIDIELDGAYNERGYVRASGGAKGGGRTINLGATGRVYGARAETLGMTFRGRECTWSPDSGRSAPGSSAERF